jgi:hypothetical protein
MYVLAISIFASVTREEVGNFLFIVFRREIFSFELLIPAIMAFWNVA